MTNEKRGKRNDSAQQLFSFHSSLFSFHCYLLPVNLLIALGGKGTATEPQSGEGSPLAATVLRQKPKENLP